MNSTTHRTENRVGGILQIGIGTTDMPKSRSWYSWVLGFSTQALEARGLTNLMQGYTGGMGHERHAAVIMNMSGGGGFESWQYLSRTPQLPYAPPSVGDLGILAIKLKSSDLNKTHKYLISNGISDLSPILDDSISKFAMTFSDPFGNYFQVVQNTNYFSKPKHIGGVLGAIIGCSDLDRSIEFYKQVLGYIEVQRSGPELVPLFQNWQGGDRLVSRVLLQKPESDTGGFSRFLGPSEIELIKTLDYQGSRIYEGRLWGDPGYIHICYDVRDMAGLKDFCKSRGHPFTIDSQETERGASFEMGKVTSRVAYIDDPDGTPIEFVETHRLPILPALGIAVDLGSGAHQKSVPDWLLKLIKFRKVKE